MYEVTEKILREVRKVIVGKDDRFLLNQTAQLFAIL